VEARALRNEEREECIALWRAVWPGDNDAYFRRYFYGDVEWLPYYTQVAVADSKIVSAVHICKRTVACGDFRLIMGGVANVATLPEYRGKGYNTACLQSAIRVMEADAMDFSLLFTGIRDYYTRQGYAALPQKRLRGTLRDGWISRPSRLRVRSMTSEDLPAVYALYDEYNRTRPIAVQRSPAYWRDWIGLTPDALPEPPLVAVDSVGRIVGYIVYQVDYRREQPTKENYASIAEYGAKVGSPSEEETIAAALLDAVSARALASGKRELHLNIPLEMPLLSALAGMLEKSEENVTLSGMGRLLHKENLLRSLLMELNERWAASGRPAGILNFQTPYGPIRLNAGGAFLRVESGENGTETLPQSALLGLVFGMLAPEEAVSDRSLHPLIATLFPQRPSIYWSADGF
jgi:GNAT superfamily N-acetyltransferase/L-amino acid N-acyltransferase YncA